MQEAGLVIKQEPYTMRVPRSQRGGEVVEPLVREQWFVRMQPLAEPALQVLPQQLCSLRSLGAPPMQTVIATSESAFFIAWS